MLKDLVLQELKQNVAFRERRKRNVEMAKFLINRYHLNILPTILGSIIEESESINRYWRMILAEKPELRGDDYSDKDKLEQSKEIILGYEVGFSRDLKQGKLL